MAADPKRLTMKVYTGVATWLRSLSLRTRWEWLEFFMLKPIYSTAKQFLVSTWFYGRTGSRGALDVGKNTGLNVLTGILIMSLLLHWMTYIHRPNMHYANMYMHTYINTHTQTLIHSVGSPKFTILNTVNLGNPNYTLNIYVLHYTVFYKTALVEHRWPQATKTCRCS